MWYFEARGLANGGNPQNGAANHGSPPASGPGAGVPLTPVSPVDPMNQGQGQHGGGTNAPSPGSYSNSSSSSATPAAQPSTSSLKGPNGISSPGQSTRTAHDLALLFMIFSFGALTDVNLPPAPDNTISEEYFQLTKAALVLEPVLERAPSVATVQTLSLIAIYEGICSRDGSVERTWGVFGVAVKLAQSVSLKPLFF